MAKTSLLWSLLLVIFTCCNTAGVDPQKIQLPSFAIRDLGAFQLNDSVIFASDSDSTYFLKFLTQPAGAPVYVSINQQAFKPQTEEWIQIDSTISSVKVSATASVLATPLHDTKTITFGFGLQDLIGSSMLYPNPVKDSIIYKFTGKSRGLVQMQIFNLHGLKLETFFTLKKSDDFMLKRFLGNLAVGVYVIEVKYGDASLLHRIIKE